MTTGLIVYDPSGLMMLDMTNSVSSMIGYVDTSSIASGSFTIPAAPAGKTLFYALAELQSQNKGLGKRPGVTLTGNTISWQYSYPGGWGYYSVNCRIHYGYH
ncbi:hypothetical protein D3C77_379510 [compost metagenome]